MSMKKLLAKPRIKLIMFITIILNTILLGAFSASAEQNEIDININPKGYLFKVENLKPGDWMPRNITIMNDGKQNFKYTTSIGKSRSVKGLFEELELLVKEESNILYEGKLKEFKGFTPRYLAKDTSETLFFQVTMPSHLGNSFQGSEAEVEIIFLAEGVTAPPEDSSNGGGGDSPGKGTPKPDATIKPEMVNKLPNTATNNYNILLYGGILLGSGGILLLLYFRKIRHD